MPSLSRHTSPYTLRYLFTTQVYIQTNDDNLERDTQTEDIETADMWCQHPPEGARGCGGNTALTEGDNDKESAASKVDEGRLSLFLQRACQVRKLMSVHVCY